MSEALRKLRESKKSRRTQAEGFEDSDFTAEHPLLFALLSCEALAGKAVKRGSVTFVVEDGNWKCVVNDKEANEVAFVSGPTFLETLLCVEKGLNEGTLDWRRQREAGGGYGRTR